MPSRVNDRVRAGIGGGGGCIHVLYIHRLDLLAPRRNEMPSWRVRRRGRLLGERIAWWIGWNLFLSWYVDRYLGLGSHSPREREKERKRALESCFIVVYSRSRDQRTYILITPKYRTPSLFLLIVSSVCTAVLSFSPGY